MYSNRGPLRSSYPHQVSENRRFGDGISSPPSRAPFASEHARRRQATPAAATAASPAYSSYSSTSSSHHLTAPSQQASLNSPYSLLGLPPDSESFGGAPISQQPTERRDAFSYSTAGTARYDDLSAHRRDNSIAPHHHGSFARAEPPTGTSGVRSGEQSSSTALYRASGGLFGYQDRVMHSRVSAERSLARSRWWRSAVRWRGAAAAVYACVCALVVCLLAPIPLSLISPTVALWTVVQVLTSWRSMLWNLLFVAGCLGQLLAANLILTARKPDYRARYVRLFRQPAMLLFAFLTVLSTVLSSWALLKASPSADWQLWNHPPSTHGAQTHTYSSSSPSSSSQYTVAISPEALFLLLCALAAGCLAAVRHIRFRLDELAYPTVWETRVWVFRRRIASAAATALRLAALCAVACWTVYEVFGGLVVQVSITLMQWCVPVCIVVPPLSASAVSPLDIDLLLHAFRLLSWVFFTRELALHLLEIFLTEQRLTLRRFGLDWFRAGLLSEDPLARALSHWELCLVGDSPSLRQLVYGEESGDTWQAILDSCCGQVDEQTQRLLVVLKRHEDERQQKRRDQAASGSSSSFFGAVKRFCKDLFSGTRSGTQRAKKQLLDLSSDLLRYVNPIPDPTMRHRRPSSFKSVVPPPDEQSGDAVEEVLTFRESLRRQYGPWWWWYKPNLILGGELPPSLFSECRTTLWAIQALGSFISHSSAEDRLGVVQSFDSVTKALYSCVGCLLAVEEYAREIPAKAPRSSTGLPLLSTMWPVPGGHQVCRPELFALASELNTALYRIVVAFYEDLDTLRFPPTYARCLQSIIDFQS
eukprot:CAMPEP_0174246744 /NCGR_PEP_ID=MMETSP0417-20130205/42225_1 /TAXON_ID=242541 /ORGANISM="Mayorella sp, Strain BSH-02190019" /LENGTH=816 /DNA_ID=CAMNT_0015326597 /DNA_START=175 /DNA_END=2625 /DNA_ORIENTATION=-